MQRPSITDSFSDGQAIPPRRCRSRFLAANTNIRTGLKFSFPEFYREYRFAEIYRSFIYPAIFRSFIRPSIFRSFIRPATFRLFFRPSIFRSFIYPEIYRFFFRPAIFRPFFGPARVPPSRKSESRPANGWHYWPERPRFQYRCITRSSARLRHSDAEETSMPSSLASFSSVVSCGTL